MKQDWNRLVLNAKNNRRQHLVDNNAKQLMYVKLVHTAIWLVLAPVVLYVLWSGVTGHITIYSWIAALAIVVEGVVLLLFKGSCPLTVVARKYSDSDKDNFDIYLPNWLARYNKLIFGSLYGVGLVLMLYRHFVGNI